MQLISHRRNSWSIILLNVQNYRILEKISGTPMSELFRARKDGESGTVLLKVLDSHATSPSKIARFKRQFNELKYLNQTGIVKTIELLEHRGAFALVLEDFESLSVKNILLEETRFSIKFFLESTIQIASTLGNLHKIDIVHGDIKPDNILINRDTGEVKVTGFGFATDFTGEREAVYDPEIIQHTLPYLSPEQTGRMNRSVDYRTDMYSLGISCYEMLTGRPPFTSEDPMSIIHGHIAISPSTPNKIDATVPPIISDIVMKLISKSNEDRYQNSYGLMVDLKECQTQLLNNGNIERFNLATHDLSNRFIIPQQLFGREKEIETLVSIFERVCAPTSSINGHQIERSNVEIVLVSGNPGIGKSSLIDEIQKPITEKRGYFVSGKYEQFNMDQPYTAIIQAFQSLISQILSESNDKIRYWKERIEQALGDSGKIISQIIPDIELIIGEQPDAPTLGPEESRNRFKYIFEKFVTVFPTAEHPVALFLDDLQWADIPSLTLLKHITINSEVSYLYLIGSYRDNEVSATHPLMPIIHEIEQSRVHVNRINLGPIQAIDVKNLISNFLKCTDQQSTALAKLIHEKTNGNPFFIIEFLDMLYNEKQIVLNSELGWEWDIERISQLQVTDNVVDFLSQKIAKLSGEIREILRISSAIGSRFDLETLAYVMDRSVDEVLHHLSGAIDEGFVSYSSARQCYLFNHDRIQEASYHLIDDKQRSTLHYRIGRKAREKAFADNNLNRKLFYIVDHLNLGSSLITDSVELDDLARMNLDAGQKAKSSSAFSPAIRYLKAGIDLLTKDCWKNQYDLTFSLYSEITEASYLNGDYEQMEHYTEFALPNTESTLDKINLVSSRINARRSQADFQGSVDTGIDILQLLGIKLPKKPNQIHVIWELARVKLAMGLKKPDDILLLPDMTDPHEIAALKIITSITTSAFFVDLDMYAVAILRALRLGLKHGIYADHAFVFAGYGIIHSAGLMDYKGGIAYGELGLKLAEQLNAREQLSRTLFTHHTILLHWRSPLRDTIPFLQEGYIAGLETGDLDFAAFNMFTLDLHSLFTGKHLGLLDEEARKHNQTIKDLNQQYILIAHSILWRAIWHFTGRENDHQVEAINKIANDNHTQQWITDNNRLALGAHYFSTLSKNIIFNNYSIAIKESNNFSTFKDALQGVAINRYANAFDSFALLMEYENAHFFTRLVFKVRVFLNQFKMKLWTKNSPRNCKPMYHAINALIAWKTMKNVDKAKNEFDLAINSCHDEDDIMIKAIILEQGAVFYKQIGYLTTARDYMIASFHNFEEWGANKKTTQMLDRYSDLLSDNTEETDGFKATHSLD